MMSGARRGTSRGSAMMRFLPSDSRASSGKQSSPPAMPMSSETQAMALICGVSHSSKYTRGRRDRSAARAATAASPALSSSTSAAAFASQPIMPPSTRDHAQDLGAPSVIEDVHFDARRG